VSILLIILPLSDIYKKNILSQTLGAHEMDLMLFIIIRVIVIGNEGYDHMRILRTTATGENSLFSNNHALPMFAEFQFEDISPLAFPESEGR
jgi:hypothetical protein